MQKPQIQLSEVSCHIIKLTMKLSHYCNQSFFLPFIKLNNPAAPIRSAPAPITLRRLERISLLSPVCGNSAWEIDNDRLERLGSCKSFSSPIKAETISFLFSSTACLLATGRGLTASGVCGIAGSSVLAGCWGCSGTLGVSG